MHRGKAWVLAGFGVLMFLLIGAFIRHSQSAEPHAPATVSRQRQTAITKQSSRKTQAASTPSQTAPSIAGSTVAQTSSSLAAFTFSAPTLQRSWSYMAYVPAGYDPHKRYPLVLMLHGMDGDDTNLVQLVDSKSLLDEAVNSTGHPAVVVFVDGGNSFYVDSPAEKMQTAIMQDLLPHLKQQFALLSQEDAHAVGGVSMGGYGALRLVLAEPQQFRIAAALSPAVWQQVPEAAQSRMPAFLTHGQWDQARWDADQPANMLTADRLAGLKIYLASGQADTTVPFTDVTHFASQLQAVGVTPTTSWSATGTHGFNYWQQALPAAYQWLLQQLPRATTN